jgi:hypothetical protein
VGFVVAQLQRRGPWLWGPHAPCACSLGLPDLLLLLLLLLCAERLTSPGFQDCPISMNFQSRSSQMRARRSRWGCREARAAG